MKTKLLTTSEVADRLGVSPRRIRALAKSRKLGQQISRGTWLFTEADIEKLSIRIGGRPPKS